MKKIWENANKRVEKTILNKQGKRDNHTVKDRRLSIKELLQMLKSHVFRNKLQKSFQHYR